MPNKREKAELERAKTSETLSSRRSMAGKRPERERLRLLKPYSSFALDGREPFWLAAAAGALLARGGGRYPSGSRRRPVPFWLAAATGTLLARRPRRPECRAGQTAEAASGRDGQQPGEPSASNQESRRRGVGCRWSVPGCFRSAPRCFWKLGDCAGRPRWAAQDAATIGKHAVIVAKGLSGSG